MCGKETNRKDKDGDMVPKYLEKCVNRLRNTNAQKFQAMCKMHLSFLLDLPNLEEFLNDSAADLATETSSKPTKRSFTRRKGKYHLPVPIHHDEHASFHALESDI